jgi:hypothetical protein
MEWTSFQTKTITLPFLRILEQIYVLRYNCTRYFMGALEGEKIFISMFPQTKTTMHVKDANAPSALQLGYVQTADQRLEDACRTKMPFHHDQRPLSSRKLASACRHYRFSGNNRRDLFASLFSRWCAAVQKSISQRPIALAEYLRHSFAGPKTRSLHEIEKRRLFRQLERAFSP